MIIWRFVPFTAAQASLISILAFCKRRNDSNLRRLPFSLAFENSVTYERLTRTRREREVMPRALFSCSFQVLYRIRSCPDSPPPRNLIANSIDKTVVRIHTLASPTRRRRRAFAHSISCTSRKQNFQRRNEIASTDLQIFEHILLAFFANKLTF